jgi:hypothetical protein
VQLDLFDQLLQIGEQITGAHARQMKIPSINHVAYNFLNVMFRFLAFISCVRVDKDTHSQLQIPSGEPIVPSEFESQTAGAVTSSLEPWDRQPREPARWYTRFLLFLEEGPARTVKGAYRKAGRGANQPASGASASWVRAARAWNWSERAIAWDVHQRELMALSERNRCLALRERRLAIAEENVELARTLLGNMHLLDLDLAGTRALFPQVRVLLRDMLVLARDEFVRLPFREDAGDNPIEITADDLRAAQLRLEEREGRSLEEMMQDYATPRAPAAPAFPLGPLPPQRPQGTQGYQGSAGSFLLVCLPADGRHLIDLAALRRVRAETGLTFKRVLACTRAKLAEALRRERGFGHPVELLHLALPPAAAGICFADGVADPNWLSERLQGVKVLLHVGGSSDEVGAWLGVVPHVITVAEEIAPEDAMVLTEHFWCNIGRGSDPATALDEALAYCPPALGEYVVRHW